MSTFHWPKLERSSWWLAGLIFLSLFLHSAAFFLFQAATPVRPPAPKPAPPVQLLTPLGPDGLPSPENIALLEWIADEDPARVARVPDLVPDNLLKVRYQPSYRFMRTAPLGAPEEPASVQFPSARDPLALILGGPTVARASAPAPQPQPTRIVFSTELAARAPSTAFAPAEKSSKPVEPTRLMLGINDEGEVRFVFLQQPSSGNAVLDAEAATFVRGLRFAPDAKVPIAWGFATFQWGDDAMTPVN
jgi:hypothetical protein